MKTVSELLKEARDVVDIIERIGVFAGDKIYVSVEICKRLIELMHYVETVYVHTESFASLPAERLKVAAAMLRESVAVRKSRRPKGEDVTEEVDAAKRIAEAASLIESAVEKAAAAPKTVAHTFITAVAGGLEILSFTPCVISLNTYSNLKRLIAALDLEVFAAV